MTLTKCHRNPFYINAKYQPTIPYDPTNTFKTLHMTPKYHQNASYDAQNIILRFHSPCLKYHPKTSYDPLPSQYHPEISYDAKKYHPNVSNNPQNTISTLHMTLKISS